MFKSRTSLGSGVSDLWFTPSITSLGSGQRCMVYSETTGHILAKLDWYGPLFVTFKIILDNSTFYPRWPPLRRFLYFKLKIVSTLK
jgi:hypothetical protein